MITEICYYRKCYVDCIPKTRSKMIIKIHPQLTNPEAVLIIFQIHEQFEQFVFGARQQLRWL